MTRPSTPVLLVQDLSVHNAQGLLLEGVDFQADAGEVVAVVGASGSGKSSLLRHLAGLQVPAQGSVQVFGHDLYRSDAATLQQLRQRMGIMFQGGALWTSLSVNENIELPLRLLAGMGAPERAARARATLALVGLDDAGHKLPAALSGGMRKRAALARALALEPALLLLDEPGSGLDPVSAAKLDDLILQLCRQQGTTIVKVTHDMASVLHVADRMVFLDRQLGRVAAVGHPRELLDHGPPAVRAFLNPHQPSRPS